MGMGSILQEADTAELPLSSTSLCPVRMDLQACDQHAQNGYSPSQEQTRWLTIDTGCLTVSSPDMAS